MLREVRQMLLIRSLPVVLLGLVFKALVKLAPPLSTYYVLRLQIWERLPPCTSTSSL